MDLHVLPGEVHLLAGENGAGKSTLIKILAGIHAADAGTVETERVAVVHQELSLIGSMSVVDNLFLGRELGGIWLSRSAQRRRASELLSELGLDLDLDRAVESYPIAVQSLLEIAKALLFDARVLVLDEPTSALAPAEVERLFGWIARLKERGVGIIYISHRMEEIYRISDRITVLRDGVTVGTWPASELPENDLVQRMIGREVTEQFPRREPPTASAPRLEVRSMSVAGAVDDVSFDVRPGEIVGVAGLQGSGTHELLEGIFGARARTAGSVSLDGSAILTPTPASSVRAGLALVTAERKRDGLCLELSVRENLTLPSLKKHARAGWVSARSERATSREQVRKLRVRCRDEEQAVGRLSGGNQQKVILGKWLETAPRVLLLSEPTRGVDVGARQEIYEWIDAWTKGGGSVVLASSDLPELLGLSDRVLVLHRGQRTALLDRAEATPERVMHAALGAHS